MRICRNLMPVSRLPEWRDWLQENGAQIVDQAIQYSPFGIRVDGRTYRVYVRDHTHAGGKTIHASIYGESVRLAKKFLKETAIRQTEGGDK